MNKTLYINGGGETTCAEHAGYELASAIKAKPLAPVHDTAFGLYVAIPPEMVEEENVQCEGCRPVVTADELLAVDTLVRFVDSESHGEIVSVTEGQYPSYEVRILSGGGPQVGRTVYAGPAGIEAA